MEPATASFVSAVCDFPRRGRLHPRAPERRLMANSPKSAGSAADDADLEEARLRQQAIGVKLRQMFDNIVNEPVPDEFL